MRTGLTFNVYERWEIHPLGWEPPCFTLESRAQRKRAKICSFPVTLGDLGSTHHTSIFSWLVNLPPETYPPRKTFFFCLLKGNQWLTSPDHKAGYFWGNYQPRSLFTDKFGSNPNTPQLGKGNPKEKMTLEMKIMWYVGFLQIGRFVSCWLLVVCCWLFVVVVVVVVGCWLLVVFCFFFAFRQGISTLYKSSDVRQFLSSSSDPCYIETFQTFLRC